MSTWILVLAFSGKAIHSVPGWKTQNDCMVAAAAWIENSGGASYGAKAICLEQKK